MAYGAQGAAAERKGNDASAGRHQRGAIQDGNGEVFHTYSSYARGHEEWIGALMILDCAPKGRNEKKPMDFVRRHDEHEKREAECEGRGLNYV
jgi:predicted dithiol-disulfide oxidoreductase (DUF899 family)